MEWPEPRSLSQFVSWSNWAISSFSFVPFSHCSLTIAGAQRSDLRFFSAIILRMRALAAFRRSSLGTVWHIRTLWHTDFSAKLLYVLYNCYIVYNALKFIKVWRFHSWYYVVYVVLSRHTSGEFTSKPLPLSPSCFLITIRITFVSIFPNTWFILLRITMLGNDL